MKELLAPIKFLDAEFIDAVDGRKLSEQQRNEQFDYKTCENLIGRKLNAGEVGCTLSHRKVYEHFIEAGDPYALVLEDDITFIRNFNEITNYNLIKELDVPDPIVLMLSGDFWYWRRNHIVSVYDCVGAYAYFINQASAKLILSTPACCVADRWSIYKNKGLKIRAILPYMIDANLNMDMLSSDVKQDSWTIKRNKMSKKALFSYYISGLIKRMLKLTGHFENKILVMNNKAVIS